MYPQFSIYDVLAMIIPGGIIMASTYLLFDTSFAESYGHIIDQASNNMCDCLFPKYCHKLSHLTPNILVISYDNCIASFNNQINLIQGFFLLATSYILGLINNWLNDGLFRAFRNNEKAIQNELQKVIKLNGNIRLRRFIGNNYDNTIKIKCLLVIQVIILWDIVTCIFTRNKSTDKKIINEYYNAYYFLSQRKLISSISFLESQVVLLRNCLIPTILLIIALYKLPLCDYTLLLVIIFLYTVMVQRQNKIYNIVWEEANYYV